MAMGDGGEFVDADGEDDMMNNDGRQKGMSERWILHMRRGHLRWHFISRCTGIPNNNLKNICLHTTPLPRTCDSTRSQSANLDFPLLTHRSDLITHFSPSNTSRPSCWVMLAFSRMLESKKTY